MSYDNVVKALRVCGSRRYWRDCRRCPYDGKGCHAKLDTDAADAIEALQANREQLKTENKMLYNTITADKGVMLERIKFLEQQLPKRGEMGAKQ